MPNQRLILRDKLRFLSANVDWATSDYKTSIPGSSPGGAPKFPVSSRPVHAATLAFDVALTVGVTLWINRAWQRHSSTWPTRSVPGVSRGDPRLKAP